ncbi:MAG: S9 family peptidase [Phenylobacterium sp.]|uniref:alpha/beta hydrolase family protein n=1 Tax=Phenylobacterium sp. TaxID=1871053 RepID=UPI0027220480|nr:S9 family peptidase [Phenylobacterium sp.]MDO9433522.1 S9 family peptidase [Phenylobacterium sp.]
MSVRLLVAAVCLALAAFPAAAAPLEHYGRLPTVEEVAISPDGGMVAMISTNGEERLIVLRNQADGKLSALAVGAAKVRDLRWADSDNLLITTSTTASIMGVIGPRREYFQAFHYNVPTKKGRLLLRDAEYALNTIQAPPVVRRIDGQPTVFLEGVKFVNNRGRTALFQVNLKTSRSKLVHEGFENTRDWLVGADGQPLAESEYDAERARWTLKIKAPTGWRTVRVVEAANERPVLLGLGRDGQSVLVADSDEDQAVLREIAPTDGVWGDPFERLENGQPIFDPKTHALIGFSGLVGDEGRYVFFDPASAKAWAKIQKAYPGERVALVSWSDDRSKVVALVDSPTEGPAYALVDFATHKAVWLGVKYENLKPADISPVRPVSFKAADGLPLSGYLTLPHGQAPKNLPLVVHPHGGPATRENPGFDWWAQAMASRGYAVLQINYRGSAGFGWNFMQAGFGQWGRKMQTDLSDGVRHLAADGTIDPKRVCIVGASYGGYAALAGATLDPGVYRCAASVAGLSDMRRFVAWSKTRSGVEAQRYWSRFMGAQGPYDPVLQQISPALNVDKVTIPILLIHGKDDTVVPLEQSRIMESALQKAGKPVEVLVMEGEDHWLSRGDTRLQMLNSVVAFLERHNPPK